MNSSPSRTVLSLASLLTAVVGLLASFTAQADVTVVGNAAPGATSWAGSPIAASVTNPSGNTSVAEGFGSGITSYAESFTVPSASSYQLDRICLYVGGGTGTGSSAPVTINLYDLKGEHAPDPQGYATDTNLLGGGSGLSLSYTPQPNGVLQLDFTGNDRVTLVAGRLYVFEIAGLPGTNPLTWLRTVSDTYAAGAAYRNRSWINGSNARDFAIAVYGTATATPQTSCTINPTVTHQVIDGFGAGAVFLDAGLEQLTDAEMDALYGTGPNQMGLTLIRLRISPNGSGDWGNEIANGQKARQRGARILATPWTPPAAMKDNDNPVHGSLLPSKYQDFVDYLNSFTDTMAASGAPVFVVSLQNEPDFDPTYEGCQWTADEFHTFCRDFAGGLKVPVMMPESYGFKQPLSDPTLSDPASAAHVAYVGGHLYGGPILDYPLAHSLGKHTWMTEYLVNDQTVESAVATGQQIQDCLTFGNMSAYIWWKTIGNANGLLDATGALQPRAYVMGQFSRFVRPGDVRIDVPANDSSLGISAFKTATGSRLAIVVVNSTTAAIGNTFNLPGVGANSVTPWVTSATESLNAHSAVALNNGAFSYTIPATSVVTFVADINVPPTISAPPGSHTVEAGATAVLSVTATGEPLTYQWLHDSNPVAGATNPALVISNAQSADGGSYSVQVSNGAGTVTSSPATLTVNTTAKDKGRLINLSLLTMLSANETVRFGFFVGGSGTSGTKPILMRAMGPSLSQYGVADLLADPYLVFLDGQTPVSQNDDWGGDAAIGSAVALVQAFPFISNTTADAAIYDPAVTSTGPHTLEITGKGGSGNVIAELYDATGAANFTVTTPRLINVSCLKNIGGMTTIGFAIDGLTGTTVLIRAIGPGIAGAPFNVAGAMTDPMLQLHGKVSGTDTVLASNDNWGGTAELTAAFNTVQAFPLASGSKDSALLVTLDPGTYTVQVSPSTGATGVALVELYEVP